MNGVAVNHQNTPLSLREIQIAELDILKAFDEFCKQHNLTYSLVGGTLLGAVRHKGFIPWDDDIDVGMPRPDYERFYMLAVENGFRLYDKYEILHDRGREAILPYVKIIDRSISVPPEADVKTNNLWIDVFPFDGCPSDEKKARKLFNKAKRYRHIIAYSNINALHFTGKRKFLYKMYSVYAKMFGFRRAIKKINRLACSYGYENAERVAGVVWGLYGMGEIISGDSFKHIIELDFEDCKLPAIYNYDEYLRGLYGDYMTPPPEDKRSSHHVTAYRNTDEIKEETK